MNQQQKSMSSKRRISRFPHIELPGYFLFVTCSCIEKFVLDDADKSIVLDAIKFHDPNLYDLWAAVIMDAHFHFIIKPIVPLKKIMHSIKSFAAHEINKLHQRKGGVWLREYYDRIIRSESDYIEKAQ